MNAQELITEISRQGIILEAENDGLRIDAPKGVLTSELRQELEEHKQAILTLLSPALILRKAQDTAPTVQEPAPGFTPVNLSSEPSPTVSLESLKHGGDLSKRLYEYLQSCPEYWRTYLLNGLNEGKFRLSRATEAARRVAQKDLCGARIILQAGLSVEGVV